MVERFGDTSPGGRERHGVRRWWALGVLGSAFFLVLLDATIVYVAIPRIQRELGFAPTDVQWVMTTYLLTFGGLLLLGVRLADVFGRRRMFLAGIGVFAAGSLLSGAAWSTGVLLTGRAVQGVGAALVAPTTLPLLARIFDEGKGRRRALGVWTAIGASSGTAGLLIGGPLTDGLGWRSVFLINVPVGLALIVLTPVVLGARDGVRARRHVDGGGAVALTAALVLLAAAIAGGATAHWAVLVGLLLASAGAFAAFAVVEVHAAEPLLPLGLLRGRTRLGGVLVLAATGVAVDGTSFLLALYLQGALGYSATMFGLMLAVMTLSAVIGSFTGQALVVRHGLPLVAAAGLALIGIGLLVLSAMSTGGSFASDVLLGLLIAGPGLGAAFVSGQIAVVAGAAETESLPASGLADTAFSVGGALGLATLSTALVAGLPSGQLETTGFRYAFLAAAGLTVIGLVATLLLPRRPDPPVGTGAVPRMRGAPPVLPRPVGIPGRSVPIPVPGDGRANDGRARGGRDS